MLSCRTYTYISRYMLNFVLTELVYVELAQLGCTRYNVMYSCLLRI